MAIDKELFYASHGLKYPVVARQYTDDMQVKEKIYTKDEMVAMLEKLEQDLKAEAYGIEMFGDDLAVDVPDIEKVIQQKINELEELDNEIQC